MKKPITVAIYSGVSKSTTFIERLIKGLIDNNVEVLIFGVANGASFQSEFINYHCYGSRLNKLIRLCKYTLLMFLFKYKDKEKLDKIIRLNSIASKYLLRLKYYPVLYHRPDIFHLQWAKSIKDWIWVQDFGIKLVVSLRGAHINYSPITDEKLAKVYTELFPQVDGFHAVSKAIAIEATKYKAEKEKIYIVKSGLNLEDLPFQLKVFSKTSCLKILSVGRSHWKKNYSLALDAMSLLQEKEVLFKYKIVGVDKDEALMFQRSQLLIEDSVSFVDNLPFLSVLDEMRSADVLLLPSLEEGIANVVLEAMALGTLVVSTDCGGMSEIITNNETGFLVPNGDVEGLTNAILAVGNLSQEDYDGITKKARLKIEQNHSNKKMLTNMMLMYKSVLKN